MANNLLHQIQNEAIDRSFDLGNLLRKCRLLAQRINNEDFKKWVILELEGYSSVHSLPDYRVLAKPLILGHFVGWGGSSVNNLPIPHSAIEKEFREKLIPINCHQGAGEIISMIEGASDGNLRISIPSDIYPIIKMSGLRDDFVLADAWKNLPTFFLSSILDSLRNRILNFTLELEEYATHAGESLKDLREAKAGEVQQIFNTHILGSVSNFNQGGNNVNQSISIQAGDIESFVDELEKLGLDRVDIEDFKDAVLSAERSKDGKFSERVKEMIGTVVLKASEGLLSVSAGVVVEKLSELLRRYYGN